MLFTLSIQRPLQTAWNKTGHLVTQCLLRIQAVSHSETVLFRNSVNIQKYYLECWKTLILGLLLKAANLLHYADNFVDYLVLKIYCITTKSHKGTKTAPTIHHISEIDP